MIQRGLVKKTDSKNYRIGTNKQSCKSRQIVDLEFVLKFCIVLITYILRGCHTKIISCGNNEKTEIFQSCHIIYFLFLKKENTFFPKVYNFTHILIVFIYIHAKEKLIKFLHHFKRLIQRSNMHFF